MGNTFNRLLYYSVGFFEEFIPSVKTTPQRFIYVCVMSFESFVKGRSYIGHSLAAITTFTGKYGLTIELTFGPNIAKHICITLVWAVTVQVLGIGTRILFH